MATAILTAVSTLVTVALTWWLKEKSDRAAERRFFDQRLRLEKEYERYVDLWEKVFELRRCLHFLVQPLQILGDRPAGEKAVEAFSAYQHAVYMSEPFVDAEVNEAAYSFLESARGVFETLAMGKRLDRRRDREEVGTAKDGELVNEQLKLEAVNLATVESLEQKLEQVRDSIQKRLRR